MKLTINGDIGAYYVQTLCLIFFPGEHFPTDAENESVSLTVDVAESGDTVTSSAQISGFSRCERGECTMSPDASYKVGHDRLKKLCVGRAVWDCASRFTGNTSPWGIMTGVRPAKVATEALSLCDDRETARAALEKFYLTSPEKAELALDVSLAEARLITEKSRNEASVYIAIPFCPTRCAYCSFVSYTSKRLLSLIPEYLVKLARDIDFAFMAARECKKRVSTVYIGGGTPTVLSAAELSLLMETVAKNIDVSSLDEFTVEAGRPDTITAEKLAVLKAGGVTRISVNTQTMNDEILRSIGRCHTSDDFLRAYELAEHSGIPEINVDLIAGLPDESADSFKRSAEMITALSPANITVHTFSVKKSAEVRSVGNFYDSIGAIAASAVFASHGTVRKSGYVPYYMYRQKNTVGNLENVGFSLPGHEGLYNIYMMEEVHSIFSAGASAVTKLVRHDRQKTEIKRIFEPKYPYEYLKEEKNASELLLSFAEFFK